nr:FimB/Mfa2 family fimbrial subunit [uncultured Prevotella sp.]
MKRKAFGRNGLLGILLAVVLMGMSSCINDDQDNCGLSVRFQYTYNIKGADAFPEEVKSVKVWIFDHNGLLVKTVEGSRDHFGTGYAMKITGLKAGKYTLVCLARDRQGVDESKDFAFPQLKTGVSTLKDLNVRLNRNADNTCNTDLAALYDGMLDIDYSGNPQTVTISLMKLTKKFRVILMPYAGTADLSADDFGFMIKGSAGWLDYKGDRYQPDSVTYTPYSLKTVSDSTASGTEEPVARAVVADLNTSRLLGDASPRLIITDKKKGKVLLNLNLTWFLSLQGIGEHRAEWSDQEYLDRQDYYNLTFFVQGDVFMTGKIVVNGWVVSLNDVHL